MIRFRSAIVAAFVTLVAGILIGRIATEWVIGSSLPAGCIKPARRGLS